MANAGAFRVFIEIDGVDGSSEYEDHEKHCRVLAFEHVCEYAFNMREGKGRGEPEHGAFKVTTPLDKASPELCKRLANKEKIDKAKVYFYRDNPQDGATQLHYTIAFEDMRVVSYRLFSSETGESDPNQNEIGFSYRKIVWKEEVDGVETEWDFKSKL